MSEVREVVDCAGRRVEVGTHVRLLKIEGNLLNDVPEEEFNDLRSMIGQVFIVSEIDEYGSAWIEKSWELSPGEIHGHSIALGASEMEVVDTPPNDS